MASSDQSKAPEEQRRSAAEGLVRTHDAVFRRTARRYSICADDAEDAYQRALEILLTKAPPIEGDSLIRWMQVVTKREAMAVRRHRERMLNGRRPSGDDQDRRDPIDALASDGPDPTDRAASRERIARSREALRSLKPQEVRALTLKAEGYSYAEIGEITGWTYTKINRCMAEGRKRFLQVFAEIEQGRRCEELAHDLSAFADGEEVDGSVLEVHLRSCGACRAKLRAFRAIPKRVMELLPLGPTADQSTGGRATEWLADKGGALADKVREVGYSVMSKGTSEGATFAGAGGTRGAGSAALGKFLAVCGATAAGTASCVAGGVVGPGVGGVDLVKPDDEPQAAIERPTTSELPQVDPVLDEQPLPLPEQSPEPAPSAPPKPAEQAATEFGVEQSASTPSGGGEFGGPTGGGATSGGGSGGGGSGAGGFGFER